MSTAGFIVNPLALASTYETEYDVTTCSARYVMFRGLVRA
jgi:hypothetical protein